MADLTISPTLVGRKVRSVLRPEWGVGEVLRVQALPNDVWRVSVQFYVGHKQLLVPPARLCEPEVEQPTRAAGWLDTVAERTLDDRLCRLPDDLLMMLAHADDKLLAVATFYEIDAGGPALVGWARRLSGAPDPLTLWSRDELEACFAEFCRRRDEFAREQAFIIRKNGGPAGVNVVLERLAPVTRLRVAEAIGWRT